MHNLVLGTVFELHDDLGQRTSINGGAGPIQIIILMTVVTIETNSTMLEPWKLAANCMSALLCPQMLDLPHGIACTCFFRGCARRCSTPRITWTGFYAVVLADDRAAA
jgi:hypothetical protein